MNKYCLMMIGLCIDTAVQAQEKETVDAYFTTGEMPDMMIFMPGPPDSTSAAFANDVSRYFWGKEMRNGLHTSERFLAQMKKAREEFKAKTGKR